jgi:hypothetical protein
MANVAAQAVVVGKCRSIIEFHNVHRRAYQQVASMQKVCGFSANACMSVVVGGGGRLEAPTGCFW